MANLMSNLKTLTLANLVALYNSAVEDYGVAHFEPVDTFKSKAHAVERIGKLCEAGTLIVAFDGETAVIVDAMETSDNEAFDGATDDGATDDGATDDGATDDGATDDGDAVPFGDGKGTKRAWGFVLASENWLKGHARGTEEREAYRKARRKAARMARKAKAKANA